MLRTETAGNDKATGSTYKETAAFQPPPRRQDSDHGAGELSCNNSRYVGTSGLLQRTLVPCTVPWPHPTWQVIRVAAAQMREPKKIQSPWTP